MAHISILYSQQQFHARGGVVIGVFIIYCSYAESNFVADGAELLDIRSNAASIIFSSQSCGSIKLVKVSGCGKRVAGGGWGVGQSV